MSRRSKQRRRSVPPALPARVTTQPAVARSALTPRLVLALLLLLATVAVYAPVRQFEFIQVDDPAYVTENPYVTSGLTGRGLMWALSATHAANWHPLTWISHMLDVELFGVNAGAHHAVNLALHVGSTLLLFGWLTQTTGAPGRSAFVAAVFALHPLHVESVAWVAERKDVLSTFLLMLTLWAYRGYVQGRAGHYALIVVLFGLGLMSKPMLVTTPFLLLLLDFWPLQRIRADRFTLAAWRPLVIEKLPLFGLVVLSSIVTFVAQQRGGAMAELATVPPLLRFQNAVVSYVAYIGKMFWPSDLTMIYPLPKAIPIWQVAGALAILIAVSVAVVRAAGRRPYLPVGWFWYVGTLVPVIGIVQVGLQAMADRYTYVPLIGLFMIVAWGVPDLLGRIDARARQAVVASGALATVALCGFLTRQQIEYWRSSVSLWQHALSVTLDADQFDAHMALGNTLGPLGRTREAADHFAAATRLRPTSAEAHHRLGIALTQDGRSEEAVAALSTAVRLAPDLAVAHADLGRALAARGDYVAALPHFTEVVRLDPSRAEPQSDLGYLLTLLDRPDEAIGHLSNALRIRPDFAEARNNLGFALTKTGRYEEALPLFTEAIRLDPNYELARRNRILALLALGRHQEAIAEARELLRVNPGNAWARDLLQSGLGGGSAPR